MQIRSSYVVLDILSKWYGIQVILRSFLNVLVSKEKILLEIILKIFIMLIETHEQP